MRIKVITAILLTLLLANMITIVFNATPEVGEKAQKEVLDGPQIIQQTDGVNALDHVESQDHELETSARNTFGPDFFVRDHRDSSKAEDWSNFAAVDGDSTELVIGTSATRPDSYAELMDLIGKYDGGVVNTVSIADEVIAVVADVPLNVASSFVAEVQASGLARYVEPNMKFQTQLVPNDPDWPFQWGPVKIEADYAWNATIGDPSVLVAVIDTGIDYDHPDLADNYVKLGYDWVNMDPDPMDDHGHGTHCAGIAAAVINNDIGIAGLAQVGIMAEKGLDQYGGGWEDDLANAIIHAVEQGADILSNSWGGYGESVLIYDAVRYAYISGVLVIAAAGNEAWSRKLYPAAYDEVIAVTATDSYDYPAVFTNFGDWVELAAPGVDIYSTLWDDTYGAKDGTSMSTPHVSGVAALIMSQFPNMTHDQVRAQLRFTADDLGDPGFDVYYGYGRINARKAVEQAPPSHDLLIFNWERPRHIQPGDFVTFNTTVLNFGTNDEGNITVQLLVNGNITDSAFIGFLASGTSATVSNSWNAMLEGTYNVTSWVVPVPDENNTANNVRTEYIKVQYITTALFKNMDPWGNPGNEEILSLHSIPYAVFGSSDFGGINLTSFQKVIIASDQNQAFYDAMNAYRWWFEDYVSQGGGLEIHAADWGWNGGQWVGTLPGGLEWYSYYADYVTIVDPTHPVVTAPNLITDTELDGWSASVHGYFETYPAMSRVVIVEDSTGYPAYLEFDYGLGVIVASSQTLEWAYARRYSLILENSLLYPAKKSLHDLSVFLEAPAFLMPGNSSLLNATVYNRGLSNETDVELFLLINGGTVKNVTIPTLVNGTSYTIDYLWTPTVEATYNVTAYAPPVPEENVTYNNMLTRFVTVTYPLITPVEGQWASYTQTDYDPDTGRIIGTGYWNLTYDYYVSPYLIYVTFWFKDPSGYTRTDWMIVNIMNRWVESGIWADMWYPGWIETNINIGSTINLLGGTATVVGSKIVYALEHGIYPIDCWELFMVYYGIPYTFWYDKASGLWVGMEATAPYPPYYRTEVKLVATNIPLPTYEHELGVALEAPLFLEPGDSSLLNATVYNIGLNNETNVELQLLINGSVVDSVVIPQLVNGSSYTLSFLWRPTLKGVYNVTAYAPPVANESFTLNNVYSTLVTVTITPRILAYVQYTDYYQEYQNALSAISKTFGPAYILTELWDYTQLDSLLPGNDILFIPEQEWSYLSWMETIGATWSETLSDFLEEGGVIILCDFMWGGGGTYGILTGAGLMTISYANYRSFSTVYLVDPEDPLAEGVSSSFVAPDGTISFVTEEENVVFNDGVYPVVIHKTVGQGDIALVGFDYYWSNPETDRILGNAVSLAVYMRISISPWAGSPGTEVTVTGIRATANGTVEIYWDDTFVENVTANTYGNFTYSLTVPPSSVGPHEIKAIDVTTGTTSSATFKVMIIIIDPVSGPVGTKVNVDGSGFQAQSQVLIAFNDMLMGYAMTDDVGNFTFVLNIPVSVAGTDIIKAFDTEGNYASATFTVMDVTPLEVRIDVGTIHFRGELAEFHAQIAFKGVAINATSINALLYKPDGSTNTLTTQLISTGFYKVAYSIPGDALTGTYALVMEANYTTSMVEARGTSFKTFLLSPTLTAMNSTLLSLNETVAWVETEIGIIKTDITNIGLEVTEINGNVATIQSTLGTIEGRIISIDGSIATMETDIGTVKADISGVKGTQEAFTLPQYATIILAFIAAVGAILSTIFIRRKTVARPART